MGAGLGEGKADEADHGLDSLIGEARRAGVTLEPGASATVEIPIPTDELAFWSVADEAWVVESGRYTVAVGSSSRDLPLSASVDVAGNEPVRVVTVESTIREAMAVPGFPALMAQMTAGLPFDDTDEEMAKMMLEKTGLYTVSVCNRGS